MNFIQWLNRLFGASANGPAQTSRNSSSPSKPSSTVAQTTPPKLSAAKSYPETKVKTHNVSAKPIKPEAIVLHHSGGSYAGGVSWIRNPKSRVSYHVLVAEDGRRTVFARPDQRTWHAGTARWRNRGDVNSWTVGASFAGNTYFQLLTDDAMASMAEYLVPVMRAYGLTIADVTDHRTVAPMRKTDLAPRELARFKAFLGKKLHL